MVSRKDLDVLEKELRCVICMDLWQDPVIATPCMHIFCRNCIELSFKNKMECPLCKHPLFRRSVLKVPTLKDIVDSYKKLVEKAEAAPLQQRNQDAVMAEASSSGQAFQYKEIPRQNLSQEFPDPEKAAASSSSQSPAQQQQPQQRRESGRDTDYYSYRSKPVASTKKRKEKATEEDTQQQETAESSSDGSSKRRRVRKGRVAPRRAQEDEAGSGAGDESLSDSPANIAASFTPRTTKACEPTQQTRDQINQMSVLKLQDALQRRKDEIAAIDSMLKRLSKSGSQESVVSILASNPLIRNLVMQEQQAQQQAILAATPATDKRHSFSTPYTPASSKSASSSSSVSSAASRSGGSSSLISPAFSPCTTTATASTPKLLFHDKVSPIAAASSSSSSTKRSSATRDDEEEEEEEEGSRPLVILTTNLKMTQKKTLKALSDKLGAELVDDFSSRVTHIITEVSSDMTTRRTLKYCAGIVCGAWIISHDWIKESKKQNRWVDESPFEVVGDASTSVRGGPKKGRKAREAGEAGLFANTFLYFFGGFAHPNPPKDELEHLARLGGATVLTKMPNMAELSADGKRSSSPVGNNNNNNSNGNNTKKTVDNTTIIVDKNLSAADAKELVQMTGGLAPVSFTWLMDCVSHYSILPKAPYVVK